MEYKEEGFFLSVYLKENAKKHLFISALCGITYELETRIIFDFRIYFLECSVKWKERALDA